MKVLLSILQIAMLVMVSAAMCFGQHPEHSHPEHSHHHDGSPVAPHWENAREMRIPDRPPVLEAEPEQLRVSIWVPIGLGSALMLMLSISAWRRARVSNG